MVSCIYASQVEQISDSLISLTVGSGGTTTASSNYYYWFQGLTRGGLNKQTALGQKSVGIGQKLTFSLNSALPNGCDTLALVLSANSSNTATTARVVAILFLTDDNQETRRTLPVSIELSSDAHFSLSGTVATAGALSAVSGITGTQRLVTGESAYYLYDAEGWFPQSGGSAGWFKVNGVQVYQADTTTPRQSGYLFGGSDTPVVSVAADSAVPAPLGWLGTGDDSPTIKLWLINGLTEDLGTILTAGTELLFIPSVDNSTNLGASLLSEKTEITPTNKIRRSSGTISTALSGAAILYSAGVSFYSLSDSLNRGYALEFEVVTSAVIGNGQEISVYILNYGNIGTYDVNDFMGSAIFPENSTTPALSKLARILPNDVGLKRLEGIGRIDLQNKLGGYTFAQPSYQSFSDGLLSDTVDQIVAINGLQNGFCRVIQSLGDLSINEAVRAIVSTAAGYQYASGWSNTITVSANAQISLVFNHPSQIRGDYPDVIAGVSDGVFQVDGIVVELLKDGVTTYVYPDVLPSTDPQTILLSNTTGTSGTSPTVESAPDFGLWGYETLAITENAGAGSLAAGSYKVRVYYRYAGTAISSISHSVTDGCIPEFTQTLSDLSAIAGYWGEPVALKSDLALLEPLTQQARLCRENWGVYIYDPTNINNLATNNDSVIAAGTGRWILVTSLYFRSPVTNKAALKALPVASLKEGELRICLENNAPYIYRLVLPSPDDNDLYLESADGTVEGWVKASGSGSGSGLGETASETTLKAIASTTLIDNQLIQVQSQNAIYQYYDGATLVENAPIIYRPNDYSSYNGVWIRHSIINSSGGLVIDSDDIGEGSVNKFLSVSDQAKIDNVPSNTVSELAGKAATSHTHVTTKGSLLTGNNTAQVELAVGTNNQVLTVDSGQASGLTWTTPAQAGVTTTTANYTQPAINAVVNVAVGNSSLFVEGGYVRIDNGGDYLISSIPDSTHLTLENLGGTNSAPSVVIGTGAIVVSTGKPGEDGNSSVTTSTASFTVPNVGNTVNISVANSTIFNNDVIVHIATAGYYKITAKPDTTTITAQNLGYDDNAAPASIITSNKQIVVAGVKGQDGVNSFTDTTDSFTVPSVNSNVNVVVANSGVFSDLVTIFIEDAGYYQVINTVDANNITAKNLGYAGNAAPSTLIASGKQISLAGVIGATGDPGPAGSPGSAGADGADGWNAYFTSSEAIAIPSVGNTVSINFNLGTSDGMLAGQEWQLTDGTLKVFFVVDSVTDSNTVVFENPTGKGNPSGTLNSGASVNGIVGISGGKGDAGATGAAGAAGATGATGSIGQFARTDTVTTVTAGNAALRVKSTSDKIYLDLETKQEKITLDSDKPQILKLWLWG